MENKMWKPLNCVFIVLLFIEIVFSQTYQMTGVYTQQPQIKNIPNQRQAVLGSLLTSYLTKIPIPERIDVITSALQRTPTRINGRKSKRHELVELLKKSAIQSLNVASNACKKSKEVKNIPAEYYMPLPVRNQVAVSRSVASDFPKTVNCIM